MEGDLICNIREVLGECEASIIEEINAIEREDLDVPLPDYELGRADGLRLALEKVRTARARLERSIEGIL